MFVNDDVDLLPVHVSSAKDLPIRERLARVAMIDDMIDDLWQGGVHKSVRDVCVAKRPVETLEELFSLKTVVELRELLMDYGCPKVPKGPKRLLVGMLVEVSVGDGPGPFLDYAALCGEAYLDDFRALVSEGGSRRYQKRDVETVDDLIPPSFPMVNYYDDKLAYVAFVPREVQEMLERLDDSDWEPYVRLAREYDGLRSYVKAVIDLRGIVALSDVLAEYLREHPSTYADRLEQMLRDGTWDDDVFVGVLKDQEGDILYLVSFGLANEDVPPDEDLIDGVLCDQGRLPPRPLTEGLRAGDDIRTTMLETPEGQELLRLLDEHVPEGSGDEFFGIDLVEDLTWDLRLTDDLACLAQRLAQQDLKVMGDLGERLFRLVERFNRVVPKWRLNGWSWAEVEKMAQGDPSFADLRPRPTPMPDFASDGVSGFALIDDDWDEDEWDEDDWGED